MRKAIHTLDRSFSIAMATFLKGSEKKNGEVVTHTK